MSKLDLKEKLDLILSIKELKKRKGFEGRKSKMKLLRMLLLENMKKDVELIGDHIIVRAYQFKDKDKPFLQIFEKKTFIALSDAFKEIKKNKLLK